MDILGIRLHIGTRKFFINDIIGINELFQPLKSPQVLMIEVSNSII